MILFSFKSTFFLLLSPFWGTILDGISIGWQGYCFAPKRKISTPNKHESNSFIRTGCIHIHIALEKLTQHTHFLQRLILNAYEEEAHAKEEAFFKFFQKLLLEDENFVGQLQPQEQQGVSSEVS